MASDAAVAQIEPTMLMWRLVALQNPAPDAIFSLHVASRLPVGVIPTMASADRFRIRLSLTCATVPRAR